MRKSFIALLLIFLSIPSFAQKISLDQVYPDGRRQVMCESKKLKVGEEEYRFELNVFHSADDNAWSIIISSYSDMSDKSEVLLRLNNGEMIHLTLSNRCVYDIKSPAFGVTVGIITTYVPPSSDEYYSTEYGISESDLYKIKEFGVSKIRIFDGTEYRDRETTNNSIGFYLSRCFSKIQKKIESPLKKNTPSSIYDGF